MSVQHAVYRDDDGELVGFVSQADGRWTAATVFGYPLSCHDEREDAEEKLIGTGLSYLAEPWLVQSGDEWLSAELVEVSPSKVTVQLADMGQLDRYGERMELTAPVTEGLRPRR